MWIPWRFPCAPVEDPDPGDRKGVLGYVYIPSLGKNAYFDKDGFVVELSGQVIEGRSRLRGWRWISDAL